MAARTGGAGATAADRATRGLRGDERRTREPRPPDQPADLDLPQVWQLTRGAGQRVAVIDTGVSRHRRLPNVVPGGDYVSTGDGTQDCDAHGTLVAGIIAAAPDSKADSFSGVAPDVTLISIRQSSAKFAPASDRSGAGVGDVDTMAKAVRTAADLGASVINISSVACVPVASALDDRALGAALAYAVDVKNAVVVAAAGNTGGAAQCPPQQPDATWETVTVAVSPAWYDDYVLTVGSVNAEGAPSAFTLAGPWVDVAATGEGVTSLGSGPLSGTSYAAPVVSGLAALIRARFPTLTARQVMQRIESTAHHPPAGWDPLVGNGTVDALAAVSTDTAPSARHHRPHRAPHRLPISSHRRRPQAAGCSRPGHRLARRGDLPGRAGGGAGHRVRPRVGYGGPATVSRATDAFCPAQFRSGRQRRQHRPRRRSAAAGRPRSCAASSSWIANRTPVSVTRYRVPTPSIRPHVGAAAGRQVDRVQRRTVRRRLATRSPAPGRPAPAGRPRQERDAGCRTAQAPTSRTTWLSPPSDRCRRPVGEAGHRQRVRRSGWRGSRRVPPRSMLAVPCESLKRSRSAATWPMRWTPAASTT